MLVYLLCLHLKLTSKAILVLSFFKLIFVGHRKRVRLILAD